MPRSERRVGRRVGTREQRQRILIVCEGAKTEPSYFKAFPLTSAQVEVVGTGTNTRTVVDRAAEREAEARRKKDPFDQVWCVFDRDSFPKVRVNEAVEECKRRGFRAAWSNEAFELWYLLHFEFCQHAASRKDYPRRLSPHLGVPYQKNDPDTYERLKSKTDDAIRNATRLAALKANVPPADANPMTTVHELVAELRKHARR